MSLSNEEKNPSTESGKVGKTSKLLAGNGYFDVTSFPYGGCFKRPNEDTPVTIVEGKGQYPDEVRVKFNDGRIGIVRANALAIR